MAKKYKCQWCDKSLERKDLIKHIEKNHPEMIPEGYDSARVVYNQVNKVDHGRCRVCGNPTGWNQKGGRYDVLCGNPKCKQKMRDDYKRNMLRVRGTYNILNDPEQQTKMLANRKISGTYTFQDGGTLTYTGSYERKCLEFMDVFMNIPSKDILSPGPTLEYEYNGKKHFYISDFYYIPYNLIIEVKDGGDNLNKKSSVGMDSSREKTLEKERIITDRGEYNYIRLTNNEFAQLVEVFMTIKQKLLEGDDSKTYRINESVAIEESFNDYFDDYYEYNIDKWRPGNPLFITGSPGSGKTTLARRLGEENNAIVISLDALYYAIKYNGDIAKIQKTKQREDTLYLKNNDTDLVIAFLKEVNPEINRYQDHRLVLEYIDWLSNNRSLRRSKIIIEGSILSHLDYQYFYGKPIIITNGTNLGNTARRINRAIKDKSSLKKIFKLICSPITQYDDYEAEEYFRDSIINMNESYVEESFKMPMKLYHGSHELHEKLKCTGVDLGNKLQEPGLSLFTWVDRKSAIGFAIMKRLHKLARNGYFGEDNVEMQILCINSKIPTMSKRSFSIIKKYIDNIDTKYRLYYIYTIKPKSNWELGFGHSSNTPGCITIRTDEDVIPDHIETRILSMEDIYNYCKIIDKEPEKDYSSARYGYNNRFMSFIMNKDFMMNSDVRRKVKDAIKSGELQEGDDIFEYIKSNDLISRQINYPFNRPKNLQNTILYRYTYCHEGIYQALRYVVSKETWRDLLKITAFTWLPKPKLYGDEKDYRAFFTEAGRRKFRMLTLPIMKKFLDLDKIECVQYTLYDIRDTDYYDDYQAIIKTDKLKDCVKRERVMNEACKDVETARKFVSDVAKIAKKYDANYFIVTDGASGIHNKGNDAVKHARDSHIEWEKENGHDPYEDWSKGKKSVKEGMFEPSDDDNPFTPWDKGLFKQIAVLNKTLTKFKYGYARNGKLIEDFSGQEFYQYYKTLTPSEFERYRGGICWDYVTYEADYFKEALDNRVKYETYFICFKDDMADPTHTFLIFRWGYLWYWFESADKMNTGIYGFKKKDNLLDYVVKKVKRPEYRPKQTILIPYDANDIVGGLTARQYYRCMYTRYYDAITIKPDKYYNPDIIYK